jgi:hypothetical protein
MIASGLVQRASGRYFVRTLASIVGIHQTVRHNPGQGGT